MKKLKVLNTLKRKVIYMNYLKRYKYLIGVIIFTITSIIFSILVQYKRADLLDIAVNKKQGFIITSILFIIFILLEIICTYFMNDFSKKYAINDSKKTRENLYKKYSLEKENLDADKKSEFINIATQQIDLLKENHSMQLTLLIFLILKSLTIIFLMLRVNIFLTVIVMLLLLTQILLPQILGNQLKEHNIKYMNSLENFTKTVEEFMTGYKLIFSFSAQNLFNKKFNNSLNFLVESDYKNFKYNNILRNINMLISYSAHFIAIILCTYLLFINVLNIKNAYLLIGFVEQLSYPLVGISFAYQSVTSFKKTREKIINKTIISPKQKYTFKTYNNENIESICLDNISIKYGNKEIIKNFNITFTKNKKYLLRGRSGIGKTTILKTLTKDIDSYSGEILFNNADYRKNDFNDIIGFMNDTPIFINDTLRNNLLLGYEKNDEFLKNIMNNLNLGYLNSRLDEEINNTNHSFSLGERKRIELARVLIRDYQVILLDEPTSNIDEASKNAIINLISKLTNKIIICTSHDNNNDFLKLFDEIVDLR
ncbi:ABC transporter ATP-binding protein [Clostridium perfringens]|nr:ABC transporter ATP-binding protein [Clostridium perfringens]